MQKAKGTDYVFHPDMEPFDQEIHLLNFFEANFIPNAKKMLKMARRLRHLHPMFIQRSFFDTLEQTRDPLKWLKRCFVEAKDYPIIMKELMEQGNHGMIMEGLDIHGFALDTGVATRWLSRKDLPWVEEQEREIIDTALLMWMSVNRRREFRGRIVLFRDFGFSGISYEVDQYLSDYHWGELEKIWAKEDHEKAVAEIRAINESIGAVSS